MIRFWRFAAVLILMAFLAACSEGPAPEKGPGSDDPSGITEFPFMGVAELNQFLADNSGKPTMVLFWATWCPSCKQEIPEMEKLKSSHGDRLNIITISLDEEVSALTKFYKGKKPGLPVFIGNDNLARKFEVSAIPTLVIFNSKGRLTFGQSGIFPHSMLKAMADNLIGQ